MRNKLKRVVSLILCLVTVVSMLPLSFAEGVAQELSMLKISGQNTSSIVLNTKREITDGIFFWEAIQVRRYASNVADNNNSAHAQFTAIQVKTADAGKYNIYFKTNNPTEISAAPEIYLVEYDKTKMKDATNKAAYIGAETEGLGHFNFSTAEKNVYAPLEKDGRKVTLELKAKTVYCIVFATDEASFALNPKAKFEGNTVTLDSLSGLSSAYTQELTVSGIKLVPEGEDITEEKVELPKKINADFEEEILETEGSYSISVTDENGNPINSGLSVSYDVENNEIMTEKGGIFTPVAPGKTKVTVTVSNGEGEISAECEVNIIGKNLLILKWKNENEKWVNINHGEFEGDIYLGDKSNGVDQKDTFWRTTKNDTTYNYEYTLLCDVVSDITGEKTNVAKFSMAQTGTENSIRLQGFQREQWSGDQRGLVEASENKLYEFTGYIKSENTRSLPVATIRAYYYNDLTESGITVKSLSDLPWDGKSGAQDWVKFTVGSLYLNYGYTDVYGMKPQLDFRSSDGTSADIMISHMAVREVALDRAELNLAGDSTEIAYGDTLETSLALYSNTGNLITLGAELDESEVKYTSSNEAVATIDPVTGVVTAVSNGETVINVTVTVNDVTREASLPVTIGGMENVISRAVVSADKTAFVCGETANVRYELFYNDGTPYQGESEVYYYESKNAGIASVSQEGVISAKSAGKTDIVLWIEADGVELKGVLPVAVADDSPLEYVEIYGSETVEVGFATRLSVRAIHKSGKPANLDACDVSFALADESDAQYLDITKNGIIAGLAEKDGPVNVIAAVTCGNRVTSEQFPVTVLPDSPKSRLIDFRKPGDSSFALNVKMEDYGWEINCDETANTIGMVPSGKLRNYKQAVQAQITAAGKTKNADLAIDIKVDYDGWYDIDFLGAMYYRGAKSSYLYMDGKYMGDFCFWTDLSTNRNYNTLTPLNTMYLTEGKHTFTLRSMTYSPEGNYAYQLPAYLSLRYVKGIGGMDKVTFTADKTSLAVGESTGLSASLLMQSGREYKFGNKHGDIVDEENNLTFTSSDTDIVKIANGRAVAVSPGTAAVTATAKIGDATKSETVNITVNEETLSRFELAYDAFNIHVGSKASIEVNAYLSNGEPVSNDDLTVTCTTEDKKIAAFEGGVLCGLKLGATKMTVTVSLGNVTIDKTVPVNVIADGFASVIVGAVSQVIKTDGAGTDIVVKAYDNKGKELDITDAEILYESSDESVIAISENGHITPASKGVADIYATVTLDDITHSASVTVSARSGKVTSTFYTAERVKNARENIKKYDWARDTAEAAVKEADKYLPYVDHIYNMIPAHTIPRAFDLVETEDPEIWRCFYCGIDINYNYGKYTWRIDAINRPWKIQCPDCKRLFPSNNFDEYYKLGLDSHGEFDYTLARENNGILCGRGERGDSGEYIVFDWAKDNPYGYGDPNGNLWNETYSELRTSGIDPWKQIPITQGWISEDAAKAQGVGYFWGVDDGKGYDTGRYHENGVKSVIRYIAIFAHDGLWYSNKETNKTVILDSIVAFRDAYVYTGDKKYGVAGAILLDRVADLYPDMDYKTDCPNLQSSHDGGGNGKIVGRIWENALNQELTVSYDAFFGLYDETEIVDYLSEKAEQWNLDNKKSNGELIRQNAEKNLCEETFVGIKTGKLKGNFGKLQASLSKAAIILDRQPETQKMIDFIYQDGVSSQTYSSGGNLRSAIINQIDRDGYADESSMGYMRGWNAEFLEIANALEGYQGLDDEDNLLKNPKFMKMLLMGSDLILTGNNTPNIGDNSSTFGGASMGVYTDEWLAGFEMSGNPLFAQLLWYTNGNSAEGLHYDIFTQNPESPQQDIEAAVEEYGELQLSKSSIATGYGFTALRGGVMYDNVTNPTKTNTMRDFWIYAGGAATTHKHMDTLNLGVGAFGLEMCPDLGYFSSSGGAGTSQGENFVESTISHNTVLVNDKPQVRIEKAGNPLHFDDAGAVKLVDIDAPQAYPDVTDTYRRTLVSVDVDDSVSYALDFFRIVGGDEHLYSFHAQSDESVIEGVELVPQPRGSYAGVDVPFGEDVIYEKSNGYNWLTNVERASAPEVGEFSIDYKITDYQDVLSDNRDLHLKLTQLNGFDISEVARADGQPVQKDINPEFADWLLVRRSGKDLETLFTSVIEPYENESKIKSLTRVPVERKDGKLLRLDEPVAAIRVELKNGRVDYVIYSADNSVTYTIDKLFDFCGFVGVYSVNANDSKDVVRTYLHDGSTLGAVHENATAAATGEIVSFTKTLDFENSMEVTLKEDIAPSELVGKMIVVNNDGVQNGSYIIKSAEKKDDNVLLGMGDVSFVRSLADDSKSYVFNISEGQTYEIPMTVSSDVSPEISVSETYTTSAGSSISIPLTITSDRGYTLVGTTLPRGMSLNSDTGVLTWKPDASQIGHNHVAVTVDNGVLSDTVHFTVTVYGSTTSKPSDTTGNTDAPVGGGGGGGGGAATSDGSDDETAPDNAESTDKTDVETGGENTAPEASGETEKLRFTDLSNHAWAADAINALADDGIVRGTTATTFSPANNITRADFALLLVRAFKLTSDNAENFADVSASDYFATELAIARNTGIVNGIGGNKYAPRNAITRQDMAVMIMRYADKVAKVTLVESNAPSEFADDAEIATYAKEAVYKMQRAGIIGGKPGNLFDAKAYATRAEASKMIFVLLNLLEM